MLGWKLFGHDDWSNSFNKKTQSLTKIHQIKENQKEELTEQASNRAFYTILSSIWGFNHTVFPFFMRNDFQLR